MLYVQYTVNIMLTGWTVNNIYYHNPVKITDSEEKKKVFLIR